MSVLFACPYCQTETVVEDAFVGQSGPCAVCGRVITVPRELADRERRVATTSPKKTPGQGSSIAVLVAVVIGCLFAGAAVIGLTVALVAPAVSAARVSSFKARSADKLTQISQAMQAYHAEYGSYPPAYVADSTGKPMHSWRVLLLPYLGHRSLYDRYDFAQPWDAPHNAILVMQMPDVYAAPGDSSAATSGETSYVVITGPSTVFPGSKSLNENRITDGLNSTILVAECCESGINWMEPRDLETTKMSYQVNGPNPDCIRSPHPEGATVVFADGQTHFLTIDLPPEYVEAFATATQGDLAALELLYDE